MKKTITALMLILCLFLTACGAESKPEFEAAPITAVAEDTSRTDTVSPGDLVPDPPYDFDPDTMVPSDFGDYFFWDYDGSVTETYKLLPGDTYETEVTVIKGAEEGPAVYVIAGIHGDEEAAWQTGKLLKKISLKAGTLYVIAPANRWGAEANPKTRYLDSKDPNRVWPGDQYGSSAEKVAWSIYSDVQEKNPDFVFDLHEAKVIEENRDFLGSTLIFSNLDLLGDMFMELLEATKSGEICSMPFGYNGPGPDGSINRTITDNLEIPTITVETFRGYDMDVRISDQLAIVQYVLEYYKMV